MRLRISLTTAILLALQLSVSAQEARSGARVPAAAAQPTNIVLPDAHSFTLRDGKTNVTYRIYVALPQGYAGSTKRFPVVYTLDADGTFALIAQAYRLLRVDPGTPDLMLIGIGYELAGSARQAQRVRDLTPTRSASGSNSGEAAAFLGFVTDVLMPAIDSQYRTDPGDRTLFGHSLGGLFALYALFERPAAFRRFIVSSPSLWWDKAVILQYESRFSLNRTALPKAIFMSVGSTESADMLEHFQPFADRLSSRGYNGLGFSAVILSDETHMTAFSASFLRGLRAVFR